MSGRIDFLPRVFLPLSLLVVLVFSADPAIADPLPSFQSEVVYACTGPIFSLDYGELNADHGGPEIAVLSHEGSVRIITPGPTPWQGFVVFAETDTAWSFSGRPTIAVGDLDLTVAGDEIASLSNHRLNVATRVWGEFWDRVVLFDNTGFSGGSWGARVGNYMSSHSGDEIFMIHEGVLDTSVGMTYYATNGYWSNNTVYRGLVGMDSAAGEFDPLQPGPEVVITTEMGPTHVIREDPIPPDNLWSGYVLWDDFDNAGWVCELADVDERWPGAEIVFGTRYNNSILVSSAMGPAMELIFTGQDDAHPRNMVDIATGNIIPQSEALEIVGVDNSGRLYLLRREQGMWIGENIWTDAEGALYAVVVADFLPEYPGEEIVAAGESGKMTLIRRKYPTSVPRNSELMETLLATLTNYPNPFNAGTDIRFSLAAAATVGLAIHSVDGKLVHRFNGGTLGPGLHTFSWGGADDVGRPVASGVYFYQLTADGQSITKEMVLVK